MLDAVHAAARDLPANPSSIHRAGQRARRALETAREQVARLIGGDPAGLIFTSGATEAVNLAVRGLGTGRVITSPLEHKAVLAAAGMREHVMLDASTGQVLPAALKAVRPEPGDLVALMLANNETGVVTDVAHLAAMTRKAGGLFFTDATQAVGSIRVSATDLRVHALALSGHKFGGPRGAGALWVQPGLEVAPQIVGGAQERGHRAGTSNVPAIVGLGVAAALTADRLEQQTVRITALRDMFEQLVSDIPGVSFVGRDFPRLAKHSSVTVHDVDGESLLLILDSLGIQASLGSACSAGSLEPSHVLLAMGLDGEAARATLRFSFGWTTTEAEVKEAAARFRTAVERSQAVAAV